MSDLYLTEKFVEDSISRTLSNYKVADFYERFGKNTGEDVFYRKANSMRLCFKFWDVDYYRIQGVKDVKRVNNCKDLFCQHCQHNLSLQRFEKYRPFLDELSKDFDLYHVVFTTKNVPGFMLLPTLNKMYTKFAYIVQYFSGARKSKFMDFSQYGYVGAVRALEVTFSKKKGRVEYHPHFHCIFIFRKGLDMKKVKYNCFSHDYKNNRLRSFSRFEILMQNFWYMLLNDIPFTQFNFVQISRGYSCTADRCGKNDYHEVFKYAIGGVFKKSNQDLLCDEVFETLYQGLYRRKILQGYGILKGFTFECDETDQILAGYYEEIKKLLSIEKPVAEVLTTDEVRRDMKNNVRFLSKYRRDYSSVEDDQE